MYRLILILTVFSLILSACGNTLDDNRPDPTATEAERKCSDCDRQPTSTPRPAAPDPTRTPKPSPTPEPDDEPALAINTDGGSLDYQDDDAGGCAASPNPDAFPACWIQQAQVEHDGVTPKSAIEAIKELTKDQDVVSYDEWKALEIDEHAPILVWCPSGNCEWVPDSSFPLLGTELKAKWHHTIAVVQAHPSADPASITTVTCPSGDCWAVPVH